MNMTRTLLAAAGVAVSLAASDAALAAGRYHVVDLGLALAPQDAVVAINNTGQAIGLRSVGDGLSCVLYDHGVDTVLGTLGGPNCYGNGINDRGVIVGSSMTSDGSQDVHAFVFENGVMTDLGTWGSDTSSMAVAINNRGMIVGNSTSPISSRVFTYRNGRYHAVALPPEAVSGYAGGLNAHGDVTGWAVYATDHQRAFLPRAGTSTDLGTLNNAAYNSQSEGRAVNSLGHVVGWSSGATFPCHAMMYRDGRMVDLGVLPKDDAFASSVATGINDRGTAVGYSDDGAGNRVAFLYDGRNMIDLNTLRDPESSGWQLLEAQAINKSGEITGLAWSAADQSTHVFLATPSDR
jgi:probable HAF family extracellular repeat protein